MFYSFRVGPYARSIYLDGTKTFDTITTDYWEPVTTYASVNFTYNQIDLAVANGFITQAKYDETIALKLLIEPRPALVQVVEVL